MVKNKVVLKERDAWSDLANFIGEMVAKYAEAMNLDNLPNPDIYLLVADELGVKPERCLIFEDIVEGIRAGKNAGMHTCAIDDAASSHIWQAKVQEAEYAVRDYYPAIQELARDAE